MNKYRVTLQGGNGVVADVVVQANTYKEAWAFGGQFSPGWSVRDLQLMAPEKPLATASTAHVDRAGETLRNGEKTWQMTGGAVDALNSADLGNRRFWVLPGVNNESLVPTDPRNELLWQALNALSATVRAVEVCARHGIEPPNIGDATVVLLKLEQHFGVNRSGAAPVDPRDEFEAAYLADYMKRHPNDQTAPDTRRFRSGDGYDKALSGLTVCYNGWKLARGLE
jgi:hypothetical protein